MTGCALLLNLHVVFINPSKVVVDVLSCVDVVVIVVESVAKTSLFNFADPC